MRKYGLSPKNPLKYLGPKAGVTPIYPFPRIPGSNDTNYPIGSFAILEPSPSSGNEGDIYYLSRFDSSGDAVWLLIETATLIGDYPITPYVVGPFGGYATVQEGLDAANAAGGGMVWVQPGTYTENLTLYGNINLHGALGLTTITGVHTPPASGTLEIQDCILTSATDILNSAAAGTANIEFQNCFFVVTNGYVFNLLNWTGTLLLDNCGEGSTTDGVVNNTGGATIKFLNSEVGAGSGNTMTLTGNADVRFDTMNINCPINIGGTGNLIVQNGCKFAANVTVGGAKTGAIVNSSFLAGASQSLTFNSSQNLYLGSCTINSSNNPAVGGTGAGTLTPVGIDFVNNNSYAATLTLGAGATVSDTFKTLPASAHLSINDTSISGEGSDTDIDIFIIPKGAGGAVIPTNLTAGNTVQNVDFVINGSSVTAVISSEAEGNTDLVEVVNHRHSNTAALGANNLWMRSRGDHSTELVVQSGDNVGRLVSVGFDGTDYAQAAEIRCDIDGTPGSNDMPGRWVFSTTPDGAQVPVEAMRIDSAQEITLANPLSETNGGTNQSTYATGDILYASAANTLSKLAAGTDGDVLTLDGGVPTWSSTSGNFSQFVSNTITSRITINAAIPYDNTIPQQGEGIEVVTVSITPNSSTSTLIIEANFCWGAGTDVQQIIAALFVDATADAISATTIQDTGFLANNGFGGNGYIRAIVTSGSTSARTYKLRVGRINTASDNAFINGSDTISLYGGVSSTYITVTEYL